jgi:hypothetical protein
VALLVFSFGSNFSFFLKTFVIFSPNYFLCFLHKKVRKEILLKTASVPAVFYPSVGSTPDKISSKVIGKVDAFAMHQLPQA